MLQSMMDGRCRNMLSGVALLTVLAALPACSRKTEANDASPTLGSTEEPEVPVSSPWCGEGFRAIDANTCIALPEHFASPPSLVVYAHGMITPDALPTKEQATLAAAVKTHGFAVLFVHGKAGLCTWEPSVTTQLCWPTQQATVYEEGPKILAGWTEAQKRAEAIAGVHFDKRYAFGFSNGGYFVSYLTAEGRFPMDGAGVVGAGRTTIDEATLGQAHPPLYLAVGEEEASVTKQDAANLAKVLGEHGWPVTSVVHPGRGHELHEDDLAGAWAAWGR